MPFANEIKREPSKHEIQQVDNRKVASTNAPERLLAQNVNKARGGRIHGSVYCSATRHPFDPCGNPCQADQSDSDESRSPAVLCDEEANSQGAHGGPEPHGTLADAIGKAPVLLSQMQAQDF